MADRGSEARVALGSVTRGTFLLLIATLVWVALNFVARVIIVRELSYTEWTEFYYALAFTGLLAAFGNLGLPQAVARNIPFVGTDGERRGIIRIGFRLIIPASVVAGGVLLATSPFVGRLYGGTEFAETLEFFSIAVASSIVSGEIAAVFQGFEDVTANAFFVQVLNPCLFIGFLLGLGGAFHSLSYTNALIAYTVANVASLVALLFYYARRLPRKLAAGPVAPHMGRRIIAFALPLFAVSLLSYVAGNVDTLILGVDHPSAVGQYGAAISLARLLLVGVGSLGYILLPVMVRFARNRDTEGARLTYGTATKWMVLASLSPFLVFFFLPGPSLRFVYGSGYGGTTLPLQILCAGALCSTLVGPSTAAQVSYGETRALVANTLVAAAFDLVASYFLIPPLGQVGAAIAWAGATALVPVLSAAELAWSYSVHPFARHYLVPLGLTSVPLGLVLVAFRASAPLWLLPALVILAALVYLLVVLVTRSLDRGDRILLSELERLMGTRLPLVRWLYHHVGGSRDG